MKRFIVSVVITLMLVAIAVPVTVGNAQETGLLDHVVISPVNPTIPAGGNQSFTAIGKDALNQTVSDISFSWSVVAGGGTIVSDTGVFTAGTTPGVFTDTIKVTAIKGDITKIAHTSVTVTAVPGEEDEEEGESPTPLGWSKGKKTGWHGATTPPGWSKGKKTGWHGATTPPGWSKGKKTGWNG